MTTPTQLGFVEPVGTDFVSTGDDDIAQNARASAAMYDRLVSERWATTQLAVGADLAQMTTPGQFSAPTSTLAQTIVGRPAEATTDPFYVSVVEISKTNGIYRQTLIQWSSTGPVEYERLSLSKVYPGFVKVTAAAKWKYGASTYFYGDSLSEQGFPNYVTGLAGSVVNRGRSGDTSNDVMLRAGIITIYGTPVGGSIPASGVVNVNTHDRKLTTRDGRTFTVWWAGIAGTLRHVSNDEWTFTRHVTGAAVAMTTPTPFVSAQAIPDGVVSGFFFGTNDAWHLGFAPDSDLTTHIAGNYRRVLDSVVASPEKRVLIFGMVTYRSTTTGSALDLMVKEVNAFCEMAAPSNFVSMQDYLVNHAMTDLGMTPTTQDTAAMAAGLIPPSLFVDEQHFIQSAQEAFAINVVQPSIRARGWA